MTASLSDSSSVRFVNCDGASPMIDQGEQNGYAITVGISTLGQFEAAAKDILSLRGWTSMNGTKDDEIQHYAGDLWLNLQEVSKWALIPEQPSLPEVVNGQATILCVTQQNAAVLTCGELISAIGHASPLTVVRLEKTSVGAVRGIYAVATRGIAEADAGDADDNDALNPAAGLKKALNTTAITLAALAAVVLVVFAVHYYRSRK